MTREEQIAESAIGGTFVGLSVSEFAALRRKVAGLVVSTHNAALEMAAKACDETAPTFKYLVATEDCQEAIRKLKIAVPE